MLIRSAHVGGHFTDVALRGVAEVISGCVSRSQALVASDANYDQGCLPYSVCSRFAAGLQPVLGRYRGAVTACFGFHVGLDSPTIAVS